MVLLTFFWDQPGQQSLNRSVKEHMSRTILVTGATGNIGGLVVPALISRGAKVRVLARNPEKAGRFRELGAEIAEGDFSHQAALDKAAQGVDAILAITPAGPEAKQQGDKLLGAAKKSGSPYYVRLSAIGAAPDAPTDNGRLHFASDDAVIQSGLPYTLLRPHYFMQNLMMATESIRSQGRFYLGMGSGKLGMIDVRDIADSAVECLLSDNHVGKVYTPTGPESIDFYQVANILSAGLDKTVEYVPIPIEAVGEAIRTAGWGEWGAQVMMDYSRAYSEGWGDFTNDHVEILTGHQARSFQDFFDQIWVSMLTV